MKILLLMGFLNSLAAVADVTEYDKVYKTYLEYCASTQEMKKGKKDPGSFGHAVLYLKGVCKDPNSSYPRLKICDDISDEKLMDEDYGTGVSVEPAFTNVNWMAVPTKKLFLRGNISSPNQVLDQKAFDETVKQAVQMGLFDGIKTKGGSLDDKQKLAEFSMGSHLAFSYGRNVFCTRYPMPLEMIQNSVNYLNSLNDNYSKGGDEFDWGALGNNCAHLAYNGLAASGALPLIPTDRPFPLSVFHLAIPTNIFVSIEYGASKFGRDILKNIYLNPTLNRAVTDLNYLPIRHGVVTETINPPSQNLIYDLNGKPEFLDFFGIAGVKNAFEKTITEPKYTDVKENLIFYKELYQNYLNNFFSEEHYRITVMPGPISGYESVRFHQFVVKFNKLVRQNLQEVEKLLENYK